MTRRFFLYLLGVFTVLTSFKSKSLALKNTSSSPVSSHEVDEIGGVVKEQSDVFLSRNGSAAENTKKIIDLIGGIKSLISPDDIVVLKPNGQWWNQGTTNTDSMKSFIELVLGISNFKGEIIIAENHHFPQDNSRGWTTKHKNGEFNLNELVHYFNARGNLNVSKYHWHDGGASKAGMWGGAENGGVVSGPEEGDGYVWKDDVVYIAPNGRKAMMSYPVFTSPYSGITLDFIKGPWKDGHYLKRKMKFINFSALNTHGSDVGVTASIKNYLGICDMTCGYRGINPKGYYNFHHIGLSNLHWRLKELFEKFGWEEQYSAIGGCVGYFMKHIRMADLNIVTAEWSGYGSRVDTQLRAHTKTILASKDPVALDYVAAKYVLLPATLRYSTDDKFIKYHNPDDRDSPFRKFLLECNKNGIGNMNEKDIIIRSYDFSENV